MYYYCYRGQRIGNYLTEMPSPDFVELTDEQVAFWREHPNATAREVMNCRLNEPYAAPEKTLEEVKSEAIKEVDEYSRMKMGLSVDSLQLCDAIVSVLFASQDIKSEQPIYDVELATDTINNFLRFGRQYRELYLSTKTAIEGATYVDEVESIVADAKGQYDEIE